MRLEKELGKRNEKGFRSALILREKEEKMWPSKC